MEEEAAPNWKQWQILNDECGGCYGADSPEPKQAEALLSAAVQLHVSCQTDTIQQNLKFASKYCCITFAKSTQTHTQKKNLNEDKLRVWEGMQEAKTFPSTRSFKKYHLAC